jgi:photosystem II stability/assembly factor-like uncharacterized protein
MARSTDQTPPDRKRRKLFANPFLLNRATVPAYRIRLREKRVLWLVGIALALAGLGALLGARLLSKPRQMRTTVKADLRVLDARLWDTVSCLGGDRAKRDGSDLPGRIVRRSLRQRRWPARVAGCRRASALLLSTTSAIIASASAAPGRLSDEIRKQYRAVLTAASRLHLAVSAVADEALAGHRAPTWERCMEAGRAVGRLQAALSRVERSAAIHHPRSSPTGDPPPPPKWAEPARLSPGLPLSGAARFAPLSRPGAAALLIPDPNSHRQPLLLLDPYGQARVLRLRSPVTPPSATLRWLDLITPASTAFAPGVYWAYAGFDARTGRGSITAGTTGPRPVQAQLWWPQQRGVSARPVAGMGRGRERLLLVASPRGLAAELVLFRSGDSGRTYSKPLSLATDAHPQGPVRLVEPGPSHVLLTYAVTGGGFAVVPLPQGDAVPQARVVIDTGPRRVPPRICATARQTLYLAGGDGQVWISTDGGRRFRTVPQPLQPFRPVVGLACLAGRAGLVKQVAAHRFVYYTCGADRCTEPVPLSWSRVDRVELTTSAEAVVILVAGARTLFSRRDPGAAGKPGRPAAVTRWRRPPQDWRVAPGPDAQRQWLLLLDGGLRRLRTGDGGKSWQGE